MGLSDGDDHHVCPPHHITFTHAQFHHGVAVELGARHPARPDGRRDHAATAPPAAGSEHGRRVVIARRVARIIGWPPPTGQLVTDGVVAAFRQTDAADPGAVGLPVAAEPDGGHAAVRPGGQCH